MVMLYNARVAISLLFCVALCNNCYSQLEQVVRSEKSKVFSNPDANLKVLMESNALKIKDTATVKKIILDSLYSSNDIQQSSTAIKVNKKHTSDFFNQYYLAGIFRIESLKNEIKNQGLDYSIGLTSKSFMPLEALAGEAELTASETSSITTYLNNNMDDNTSTQYLTLSNIRLDPKMKDLDLRKLNINTKINEQGGTKACWAFSVSSAYDLNYQIFQNQKINTSPQHIIDCSGAGTVRQGGVAFKAFQWMVESNKNLDKAESYKYIGLDQVCTNVNPSTNYYSLKWGLVHPSNDPNAIATTEQIKEALCKYGAIVSSVYQTEAWLHYNKDDVFKDNRTYTGSNHSVVIIGWDDDKRAWLIKNSYGTDWGGTCNFGTERGYMWLQYNIQNIGRRAAWVIPKSNP